ncbi:hypothetical protein Htur_5029 (plasmid) [Haloterrigena turkmenica DSM 5511]|uniref:Uncharacterized protein n=1 Tax=Haloterrigena turkmenica (strain ATCC 51198 / DSM 5511 / JCM 9101 / NCIMB 13204 / VKM B-1734 / 4k) TaxID=543526 RepID=D2S3H0_HALTV|nr:hypothetical protein [Haloterrigena turkmenica]ADB63917.1 hypothetical protein Htur_5029 [Haloterrigena turkmenica DSM 5511]
MGSLTTPRVLFLCLVLVLAPIGATMPATASTMTMTDDQPECETTVTHDAFRTDNETVTAAQNGTATSTVDNTDVSVDTDVGFVHLNAKNPNGYCVRYVVEMSPDVIDPADLGHIDANNGSETATWRAIHDFDADETYTEVEFVLQGGEEATFAPSKLRVTSLKWTGTAKNATNGWLPQVDLSLGSLFGDGDLEQRQYTLSAENNSEDSVSVSLANESLGKEVSEYQAVYRTDDGRWTPVGTDTGDPVYKSESGDGSVVNFHFNDADAEVEFTANPTAVDKAKHQYRSYLSGIDFLDGIMPGLAGGSSVLQTLSLPLVAEVKPNP